MSFSNQVRKYTWTAIRPYVDGWIPRFSFFVPLIGYLILFNDQAGSALQFDSVLSGGGEAIFITDSMRLKLVYFGLIFLGLSNLLYRVFSPQRLEWGLNSKDYNNNCFMAYSYLDFTEAYARIENYDKEDWSFLEYDRSWEGFKEEARTALAKLSSIQMDDPARYENVKARYDNTLKAVLKADFEKIISSRLEIRILLIVLSTFGYIFLAVPSIEMFMRVVFSIFS